MKPLPLILVLAVAPLLLAPLRFQQNGEEILLTPAPRVGADRGPAAVTLPSPTVIQVSPTRAAMPALPPLPTSPTLPPSPTAAPARPQPPAQPPAAPANGPLRPGGIPPMTATICVRALGLVDDLAAVSMAQSESDALVPLTIAVAMAQIQVAQGQWPNVTRLRQQRLPLLTPYRSDLQQALDYVGTFCTNPNRAPRGPTVPRPR